MGASPQVTDEYLSELASAQGQGAYVASAGNYPLLRGVQGNLYKCFIERTQRCLSSAGAVGIIHQKGLYDDPKGGKLRAELATRLRWHLHCVNKLLLFTDIKENVISEAWIQLFIEKLILTALETTTYTVSLTTPLGCVVTDEIFIRVLDFIPSGFTPDGDGVNDVWNIPGIENYPNSNIKVFNRWGQMVFESTGYKEPWDGKYEGEELPAASYFYTIEYNVAGTENLSGTVTIIR